MRDLTPLLDTYARPFGDPCAFIYSEIARPPGNGAGDNAYVVGADRRIDGDGDADDWRSVHFNMQDGMSRWRLVEGLGVLCLV